MIEEEAEVVKKADELSKEAEEVAEGELNEEIERWQKRMYRRLMSCQWMQRRRHNGQRMR